MSELLIPSMRGLIGDWAYYSCLMKLSDVAQRVGFADRIYGNKNLNKLVQRELKGNRAKQIADYLINQEQRFFGSLIVASYGGDPEWYQLASINSENYSAVKILPQELVNSLGILRLSGQEHLFALDGQHRLAGIKKAIAQKPELGGEEVNVIFVSHHDDQSGLDRSRRLFTTLNKKSVPVRIGEVIALDVDDVMAIVTRRLVREYPLFLDSKVSNSVSSNIPAGDNKAFTTLAALYAVLKVLFIKIRKNHDSKTLLGEATDKSLTDSEIDDYYKFATDFFDLLSKYYPHLQKYAATTEDGLVDLVAVLRNQSGGHIIFRPVGLKAVVAAIAALVEGGKDMESAIAMIASCPTALENEPFKQVLFNPSSGKVIHKGVPLASKLLQYMAGLAFSQQEIEKLKTDYAKTLGVELSTINLPQLNSAN